MISNLAGSILVYMAGLASPQNTLPEPQMPTRMLSSFRVHICIYLANVQGPLLSDVSWSFSGTGMRTGNIPRRIDWAANLHIGTGLGLT